MMNIKLLRRITQVSTILLIIAIPILNTKGITVITGTLYSLAIDGIWITDPLSGLQVIITSLSINAKFLLSMLIPVAVAFFLGRVFCGWMCPQNFISEVFDVIHDKLKIKRLFNPEPSATPRYIIMFLLLLSAPLLGFPVANLIFMPGMISVQTSKYIYEGVVGLELSLIGMIILSEIFILRRVWCNYICPAGSFLGILRFKKTLKVVYVEDEERVCGGCLECVKACQLGLNPLEEKIYPLCHNCGDCVAICRKIKQEKKPLSFKF